MNSRIILSISFLIIALSLGYYFVIFLPNLENKKQELEAQKQATQQREEENKKNTYSLCAEIASSQAKALIKEKAQLPGGEQYREGATKGMYLKPDYDYAYQDCLKSHGIGN